MKKNTKTLKNIDKSLVWHPFTQMKKWEESSNLIIDKGKGNYIFDTDGKKYLDAVSSLWVTVHGHNNKKINNGIKKQIDKISHSTLLGLGGTPSIELACLLKEIMPVGLNKFFYSDNGSTAVEVAMKMAFQYLHQKDPQKNKKKKKFICFTGAYHGDTMGSMAVGEIDVFVKRFKPLYKEAIRAPYAYCYRCPVAKNVKEYPDCQMECIKEFEKIVKKYKQETVAVIVEPMVQGASGMVVTPKGWLKEIERIAKKHDILLILDEVATGFGRTGKMFALEHEKIKPDFLCLAKGITGGYLPLAVTVTKKEIYNEFLGSLEDSNAFYHGHTYTGNALGSAAAIANLEIFKKEKTLQKIKPNIKFFKKTIDKLNKLDHVGEARSLGYMAGIELVEDKKTKKPFASSKKVAYKICDDMMNKGFRVRPIGDTIIICLPLSITIAEITKLMKELKKSIIIKTKDINNG